ncbi:hypothetical protein KJJ36_13900 [Staphylococcus pseudoxylosus]|uniref:hypothetical protein n=1 Tax=Staphylococcus pseudoxylosus TaxID=2282419 RepID=UPI001F15A383|nr:hypothetical protein [Staphylococcus pseudoxylosus]MCE5003460.1 hypothetical protein [Staphylococcus pseudoxylosus]
MDNISRSIQELNTRKDNLKEKSISELQNQKLDMQNKLKDNKLSLRQKDIISNLIKTCDKEIERLK